MQDCFIRLWILYFDWGSKVGGGVYHAKLEHKPKFTDYVTRTQPCTITLHQLLHNVFVLIWLGTNEVIHEPDSVFYRGWKMQSSCTFPTLNFQAFVNDSTHRNIQGGPKVSLCWEVLIIITVFKVNCCYKPYYSC